jgi:hypothetical protein
MRYRDGRCSERGGECQEREQRSCALISSTMTRFPKAIKLVNEKHDRIHVLPEHPRGKPDPHCSPVRCDSALDELQSADSTLSVGAHVPIIANIVDCGVSVANASASQRPAIIRQQSHSPSHPDWRKLLDNGPT